LAVRVVSRCLVSGFRVEREEVRKRIYSRKGAKFAKDDKKNYHEEPSVAEPQPKTLLDCKERKVRKIMIHHEGHEEHEV
jgi:hypothetical protein